MKKGFTLIEMVAVLLIIALLAAAITGGLASARYRAWRTQARESCRQLSQAWGAYLLDERKFPEELGTAQKVRAEYDNIKYVAGEVGSKRVYFELSEAEKESGGGLRDHWKQLISFSLDTDYDGVVQNPHPEAFGNDDGGSDKYANIRSPAIAWSEGDPKKAKRKDNPIVAW